MAIATGLGDLSKALGYYGRPWQSCWEGAGGFLGDRSALGPVATGMKSALSLRAWRMAASWVEELGSEYEKVKKKKVHDSALRDGEVAH